MNRRHPTAIGPTGSTTRHTTFREPSMAMALARWTIAVARLARMIVPRVYSWFPAQRQAPATDAYDPDIAEKIGLAGMQRRKARVDRALLHAGVEYHPSSWRLRIVRGLWHAGHRPDAVLPPRSNPAGTLEAPLALLQLPVAQRRAGWSCAEQSEVAAMLTAASKTSGAKP